MLSRTTSRVMRHALMRTTVARPSALFSASLIAPVSSASSSSVSARAPMVSRAAPRALFSSSSPSSPSDSSSAAPTSPIVIPESEYERAALFRELDITGEVARAEAAEAGEDEAHAHMRNIKMDGSTRRFYGEVSVTPEGEGRFALRLGGHIVATPDDNPLILPNKAYALLVALEFENQMTFVYPHTMPLTYFAAAVHDRATRDREQLIENVMSILRFDSTLYREEREDAPGLARLQEKHWDPVLEWLAEEHGIELSVTYGMQALQMDPVAVERFSRLVNAMDAWELVAMEDLTSLGKSAVLALAFLKRELDVDRAFRAMRVEETFQLNASGRVEGIYGTQIPEEHAKLRLASMRTAMNLREFKF